MRYRKKPVVIDAIRFDGTGQGHVDVDEWAADLIERHTGQRPRSSVFTGDYRGVHIDTLEGQMTASAGDWIICGVQGEFYPCKPDIFEAIYEPAEGGGSR